MGKSKRNDVNNCPLCLWPPKQASGFGPVWVILEPVSPFLWSHKGLNGPKSSTVGQSITILLWWGPLGDILGHFRVPLEPRGRG